MLFYSIMSLMVSLFSSSGTPEEIIGTSQFLLLVAHFVFNAVFDKFFISVLHVNELPQTQDFLVPQNLFVTYF